MPDDAAQGEAVAVQIDELHAALAGGAPPPPAFAVWQHDEPGFGQDGEGFVVPLRLAVRPVRADGELGKLDGLCRISDIVKRDGHAVLPIVRAQSADGDEPVAERLYVAGESGDV